MCPRPTAEPELEDTSPLRGLLTATVNAILYATSSGIEPRLVRPGDRVGSRKRSATEPVFTSDEVYFLAGAIEISAFRG